MEYQNKEQDYEVNLPKYQLENIKNKYVSDGFDKSGYPKNGPFGSDDLKGPFYPDDDPTEPSMLLKKYKLVRINEAALEIGVKEK